MSNIIEAPTNQRDAMSLVQDLSRQFISISFAGIGFIVGISQLSPTPISSLLFWVILFSFMISVIAGLLLIMHSISKIADENSYNIWSLGIRTASLTQIIAATIGVLLLGACLGTQKNQSMFEHNDTRLMENACSDKSNHTSLIDKGVVIFVRSYECCRHHVPSE